MKPEANRLAERVAAARAGADRVVLEGFHALKHALRFGAAIDEVVVADPDRLAELAATLAPDLLERMRALGPTVIGAETLNDLTGARSHGASDVLAIAQRPPLDLSALLDRHDPAPLVLLEEPTHLGNLGAVVRVAAAADAAGVLTSGAHDPWHPAALRGSAGLHFALPVGRLNEVEQALSSGRPLVAADPDGEVGPGALPARAVIMLGSERRGLSPELVRRADVRVRIPMRAGVSSLNLATAAAILLYAGR